MKKLIFLIFLVLTIENCTPKPKLVLTKSEFTDLKNWPIEKHKQVVQSFIKNCNNLDKKGWKRFFNHIQLDIEIDKNLLKCSIAEKFQYSNSAAKKFLEEYFVPYLVKNNEQAEGLFTGYYELALKGSLTKKEPYIYPIYRKPYDLQEGKKYFTRAEIDKGALANKGLEIAYTDDLVRLFFLHIQGSGVVLLDNNKELRITYAGQNGYKYFSIGKYLWKIEGIDKEKLNAEFIINWLKEYNFKADQILNQNHSYIFFRKNNAISPIGAAQIPLTAERSLAVDRKFLPLGSIMWIETKYPDSDLPFTQAMLTEDTGGAIKGPVRGDIYFGSGEIAEKRAYYMKNRGKYYILLPREIGKEIEKRKLDSKN